MEKTKIQKNKGITLIALVITIIILLILVGIAISSLMGDGLLDKTKTSKEMTEYSSAKEIIDLKISEVAIEYEGMYSINEIRNSIENETEKNITLEKYYFENQAKLASDLQIPEENLVVKGIVVSANQYPQYKFLIGKGGKIQGATTINMSNTTKIEEFIDIEEFAPSKVQTDLSLPTILKMNTEIIDKTTIKTSIILRNEQNVKISYSIRKKGANENLKVVENTTKLENLFENLETYENYTITIIAENEKGKSEKTIDIGLETIELAEKETVVYLGKTKKLEATAYTKEGNVKWTSSNTNVATVDQNGNVRAVSCGEVIITVKSGDVSKDITVNVTNDILQLIEKNEDLTELGITLSSSGCTNGAWCNKTDGFGMSAHAGITSPYASLTIPGEYLTGRTVSADYMVHVGRDGSGYPTLYCKIIVNYEDEEKDESEEIGVVYSDTKEGTLSVSVKNKPVKNIVFQFSGSNPDWSGGNGHFKNIRM